MDEKPHNHAGHLHAHTGLDTQSIDRAFAVSIALNGAFVVVEAVWGFLTGSLALLSDAGHNLGDVGTLLLALIARKLHEVKPNLRFTYGYRKSTILVSLINSVFLLITVGIIGYEAVRRLLNPAEINGMAIAIVAAIGIVVNGLTALLFRRGKDRDLNVRGAFTHLAADAVISSGVVLAGVLIYLTGWTWLDSAVSFVIIAVITYGTWGLLKDSLMLSLAGVPSHIDIDLVREAALEVDGVKDIHHIHVWAISTTQTALTAHVVIAGGLRDESARILGELRSRMEGMGISHSTIELENESATCGNEVCV